MAEILERKDINQKYKWDLTHIINGDKEWEKKFEELKARVPELLSYKGKLGDRNTLLKFLKIDDEISIEFMKLYFYAVANSHTDTRDNKYQEMASKVENFAVQISAASSFIEPEICKRSEQKLIDLSKDEDFKDYSYSFKKLAKNKKHILSEREEKLLAEAASFGGNFEDAFDKFNDADIKFDSVNVDGEQVELSHGTYGLLLQNSDKNVRRDAFNSTYKTYKEHINTIASIYGGSVKKDWFYSKSRGFKSCLERALSSTNVDMKVYDMLLKVVTENCSTMHDYMAFRKQVLGFNELNMYDLYVSLVKDVNLELSYEDAFKLVKTALQPMGDEYVGLLQKAYDGKWIDVMENKGKRSGAYSWDTYACHPYVLLNYQKTTFSVFTIAHELGHALHSYYSSHAQPFAKADYEIFVAEIASTVNEVLLLKHLLLTTTDKDMKKFLLSYYLDMFRTTLFRQTMFAEFELKAHEFAEKDIPITAKSLSDVYYELNKKYYGPAVCHDDLIRYEWARVPHFYRAYYVYQYSTGFTSAVSIATNILKNGEKAFNDYKKFLCAGGSMPPVEILKLAGVDMTTEEPFKVAMDEFKATLAELKSLYD